MLCLDSGPEDISVACLAMRQVFLLRPQAMCATRVALGSITIKLGTFVWLRRALLDRVKPSQNI